MVIVIVLTHFYSYVFFGRRRTLYNRCYHIHGHIHHEDDTHPNKDTSIHISKRSLARILLCNIILDLNYNYFTAYIQIHTYKNIISLIHIQCNDFLLELLQNWLTHFPCCGMQRNLFLAFTSYSHTYW